MLKIDREKEFDTLTLGSVEIARDLVWSMLKWTQYIPQEEF